MQSYLVPAIWLLAAYLTGGIPFGFLIGKARGVDVRTVGSRNIGATNVFRTVGRKWGFLALFCDMMKGFLPTCACRLVAASSAAASGTSGAPLPAWLPLAVGVMCAVGHMLTPYMKFRGGKGVATGAGMLLGLVPALAGVTLLVFVAFFAVSNYISLGSCCAAAFIGIAIWFPVLGSRGCADWPQGVLVSLIAAFVIWKHRANIGRLVAGTENKIYIFGKKEEDKKGEKK
ncbi:MAG: glycerol-3-phosphate 1-O-acyltransferase PlsY [Kiritimatiellia bacterium]